MPALIFHELASLHDPLLLPWLDLYETAFPPEEKVLVSGLLQILQEKELGRQPDQLLLAALDQAGAFAGLASCQFFPAGPAACLWYLATQPQQRGQGLGALLYQEVLRRAAARGCAILLHEAEIPSHQPDDRRRRLAERRLAFFHRLGARRLDGIDYLQSAGSHQAPIPMLILVSLLQPVSAARVYELLCLAAGPAARQAGPLALAAIID